LNCLFVKFLERNLKGILEGPQQLRGHGTCSPPLKIPLVLLVGTLLGIFKRFLRTFEICEDTILVVLPSRFTTRVVLSVIRLGFLFTRTLYCSTASACHSGLGTILGLHFGPYPGPTPELPLRPPSLVNLDFNFYKILELGWTYTDALLCSNIYVL